MSEALSTISENVEKNGKQRKMVFEDAMTMTGFGRFNVYSVLYCGFMLLGMILETLGFSYIIPACQCDLELSLTSKTWLPVIPFIAIILTSHMWGYLADTKGRKKILALCMGAGSCFSIMSSFSHDLITFAALRFIAGVFIAGPSALGYAYLGELNPKSHRDKMLTLGNASVAFGTAVVPLVSWAVLPLDFRFHLIYIDYRPWRLLVCLFALPYVICAICIVQFPESPKFLMAQGQSEEALDILKQIYSVNSGKSPKDFPVTCLQKEGQHHEMRGSFLRDMWEQTVPLFRKKYIYYTLLTCFLQMGVFAATNGFYIWFPAVLNKVLERWGMEESGGENICAMLADNSSKTNNVTENPGECNDILYTGTFTISIALSLCISAITVTSAFMINKIGKKNLLIGFFLITSIAAFVLHWITNTIAAIVVFSLIQLNGTCIGLINAYVVEIFPTNVRAMAVCLTLMIGRVGSMIGTNLIGYLIYTMCPAGFFGFSGLLICCAAFSLTLPKSNDTKSNREASSGSPS